MKKEEIKKKGLGKKGFSLVELIIVIAIMAILIGIIGSQAIPYLEKSRRAKDLQTLDTVVSDFQTAIADVLTEKSIASFDSKTLDDASMSDIKVKMQALNASLYANASALKGKFKSNDANDAAHGGTADVSFTYHDTAHSPSPSYIEVQIGNLIVSK